MVKPNYKFEKRQRDIAKKKTQAEKRQRKVGKPDLQEGEDPETSAAGDTTA